jgi:hypothetical protein
MDDLRQADYQLALLPPAMRATVQDALRSRRIFLGDGPAV